MIPGNPEFFKLYRKYKYSGLTTTYNLQFSWSLEFRLPWSLNYLFWGLEFGVQTTLEFELPFLGFGVQTNLEYELPFLGFGVWSLGFGVWSSD